MVKNLLTGVVMTSLMLAFSSCSDTFDPTSDQEGRIVLDVSVDHSVAAPAGALSAAPSRAASARQITVSELQLALRSTNGGYEQTWAGLADFDPSQNFPVGNYVFEAFYGTAGQEGFDLPYYYGSTEISVRENETTPVSLTASLANAMVSVEYTDAFKQYFTKYATSLQTAKNNTITFEAAEVRAAYVSAGHVEVFANVTKPNGVSAKLSAASFDAVARNHYVVKLDVDAASSSLNVTFSSELVETTVDIDVTDDVLTAPAPTITAEGFTPGETLTVIEGSHPGEKVRMVVTARGEVATGILTTDAESLLNNHWPASVDFDAADAPTLAVLANNGLVERGLTGVKSQMAVLDLTEVLPHLSYEEGGSNTSTFTLVAKDKYSKVSEPMTLTVAVERLAMNVVEVQDLYIDAEEMSFNLTYNGSDIDRSLKVMLANNRGTYSETTIKSITKNETKSTDGTYNVVVAVPAEGSVKFYCAAGSVKTAPITVERSNPTHSVSVNENDVFAKSATATFATSDGSDATTVVGSAEFYLSAAGGEFGKVTPEISGTSLKLSGLTPGTAYRLKALRDGKYSAVAAFTTEVAAQLPNGDMEQWSIASSGSHWQNYVVGTDASTPWGTNNTMTTQQGADLAYCRSAGTVETTDAHTGKAALLRSIGWGSGNTGTFGVMKYGDAGLLHLGANRTGRPDGHNGTPGILETTDLNCGMAFASRPASVSFWYKYSKKNSADAGMAEVWVKDASDNIIASGELTLTADTYTRVSIPLTYGASAPKAAKIYVKFLSTNDVRFLEKNWDYFSKAGIGVNDMFLGSQLYIDDIVLNY